MYMQIDDKPGAQASRSCELRCLSIGLNEVNTEGGMRVEPGLCMRCACTGLGGSFNLWVP